MTTEVIYARVPAETKRAAEAYADDRALTLAGALTDLLAMGLLAVHDERSIGALQAKVQDLERALHDTQLARREETLKRERAEQEARSVRQAADAWLQRAELRVGTCPNCQQPIRGSDLLVSGRCTQCGDSLGALMEPKTSQLDSRDLMLALGAAGLILGLVAVTRGGN